MSIYLDNAATTQIDAEVIEAICKVMEENYGNPSSVHAFGRKARAEIEKARRTVSSFLKVSPAEIFFTSGGTEADNMAILCSIRDLGVKHIITSKIEHHAVLHSVEVAEANGDLKVSFVKLTENGHIDLNHLEELLQTKEKTLVSLMHANNEIGNLIDLKNVSTLCRANGAYFHSDTVQTMCHYVFDLAELDIDFITASAHKFHGAKGIGFLYINSKVSIKPMIHGGAQERNMRGGTENIYGIVGLAKAMEVAYRDLEAHQNHVQGLKTYMIERLRKSIPDVRFNGDPEGSSLYTVLNVCFPDTPISEMLLFNLDIMGISASGGSACSSGSSVGSHVLAELVRDMKRAAIRFSFSKYNTKEEIDHTVAQLSRLFAKQGLTV
ncbi:MAG TPA: cysteine desulfurase [Flavobacteriales bacterium]|nr:cysteine desulfurase [Flavobacteriales bacterium]